MAAYVIGEIDSDQEIQGTKKEFSSYQSPVGLFPCSVVSKTGLLCCVRSGITVSGNIQEVFCAILQVFPVIAGGAATFSSSQFL